MLKALVLSLATSYLAWFIQRHEALVLYPFDTTYTAVADTGEARLTETRWPTSDGESLVVWTAPAADGRPTVLYLMGNAGTLAGRADRFGAFLDRGAGVVAHAYRGSSGSTGTPSEAALAADAEALAADLAARAGGPLLLYGESFGAALAVKLAARGVGDGVILQSPFTSIPDLVRVQYPGEEVAHLFTELWDSRTEIAGVRQPLLILHGTADRLVPIAQGEELLARAGSGSKTLVALDGAGHNGVWSPRAETAVFDFLARF